MDSVTAVRALPFDVHAHVVMPRYQELLARFGVALPGYGDARAAPRLPAEEAVTDNDEAVRRRIALMDDAGVARQLLSATYAPYLADERHAVEAARVVNDVHARLVSRHGNRFSAFAALPLPHVDAALRELERGLDELGMIGVGIQCFCLDRSIADDHFGPVYEELNRREAVLFLHPCVNGICSPLVNDWGLAATAGALFEDTTVALHLILKRVPHRYPKIKIIVPHLGGALPMLLNRLDNQLGLSAPGLPEKPSVTARRFFYDTVGHGSKAALRCAVEAFGAERILPGSDYPVLLPFESYPETFGYLEHADLPEPALRRIFSENAGELFGPRLTQVTGPLGA